MSCWAYSKDGSFSLKFAYLLAKGFNPFNPSFFACEWIWKASSMPRIMFFLWLCIYNSVPTCEVLGSRGFTLDNTCPICHRVAESLNHFLRGCFYAKDFWNKLGIPSDCKGSFVEDMVSWLHFNCTSKSFQHGVPWKIIFPIGVWHLWLHRNAYIFRMGIIDKSFC